MRAFQVVKFICDELKMNLWIDKEGMYGFLIELFLQISCFANSTTNSIINKPQFDLGHAPNETEVIKRNAKLNLGENLNDAIKLESKSNISTHDGCNFNEPFLNVGNLVHYADVDQEQAESNNLIYEPDEPLESQEYMFKNGKKVPVPERFKEMQNSIHTANSCFRTNDNEDNEELDFGKPAYEDLVTWVNKKFVPEYHKMANRGGTLRNDKKVPKCTIV